MDQGGWTRESGSRGKIMASNREWIRRGRGEPMGSPLRLVSDAKDTIGGHFPIHFKCNDRAMTGGAIRQFQRGSETSLILMGRPVTV